MEIIENCLYGLIYSASSLIVLLVTIKTLRREKKRAIRPDAPQTKKNKIAYDDSMLGCAALYRLGFVKGIEIDSLIDFVDIQHDQLDLYIIDNGFLVHLDTGDKFII